MKTRKILAMLMAILMLIGCMAACGGKAGTGSEDDTKTTDAPVSGDEVVAGSNNDGTSQVWSAEKIAMYGEAIKGEANGGTIKLKVWGPDDAQALLKKQTAAFSELFKDYAKIEIEVKVQGEADASAAVLTDPASAADVFGFPNDQFINLVNSDALAEVMFTDDVINNNTAASVEAATKDGKLYAYPETGDNSYILVYDKRYVTDEQAKTFEGVIEACKAANKEFLMDAKNGFFSCSFLFTGGLEPVGLEADGETHKFNDYDIDQVTASVKAFADLFKSAGKLFVSTDPQNISGGFKNGTCAAGIAGSWNMSSITPVLGDNAGYAVLPTININGTDTRIVNMFGYKLLGVNKVSKYQGTAQILTNYLTNYENQLLRTEELQWTPSNVAAQESDIVDSYAFMKVFMDQSNYSVPQSRVLNNFFDPIKALGVYMLADGSDLSDAALKVEVEKTIANIRDEG